MNPVKDYYADEKLGRIQPGRPLDQRESLALELLLADTNARTFLDIGCGDGVVLRALREKSERGGRFCGIDISAVRIQHAMVDPRNVGLELSVQSASNTLNFSGGSFDAIFSGEVIEHLLDPDQFFDECARLLRPSGLLVLTTPNFFAWHSRILAIFGIQPVYYEASTRDARIGFGLLKRFKIDREPVGHIRLFTYGALKDLAEASGFSTIRLHGATFDRLPSSVAWLDRILSRVPSLASGLVLSCRRE